MQKVIRNKILYKETEFIAIRRAFKNYQIIKILALYQNKLNNMKGNVVLHIPAYVSCIG